MHIYCDESGGVGRGVMTLAAVAIDPSAADQLITQFRSLTGLTSEVKGSRIDLTERAIFLDLFAKAGAKAVVGFSAIAPRLQPGCDRGALDRQIYARLLDEAVRVLLLESGGCASITIDDGRYAPDVLQLIREEIAAMIGPCGTATLELSHRSAGLQIADVIANTMFNRALPTDRQSRFIALAAPLLAAQTIRLELLDPPA